MVRIIILISIQATALFFVTSCKHFRKVVWLNNHDVITLAPYAKNSNALYKAHIGQGDAQPLLISPPDKKIINFVYNRQDRIILFTRVVATYHVKNRDDDVQSRFDVRLYRYQLDSAKERPMAHQRMKYSQPLLWDPYNIQLGPQNRYLALKTLNGLMLYNIEREGASTRIATTGLYQWFAPDGNTLFFISRVAGEPRLLAVEIDRQKDSLYKKLIERNNALRRSRYAGIIDQAALFPLKLEYGAADLQQYSEGLYLYLPVMAADDKIIVVDDKKHHPYLYEYNLIDNSKRKLVRGVAPQWHDGQLYFLRRDKCGRYALYSYHNEQVKRHTSPDHEQGVYRFSPNRRMVASRLIHDGESTLLSIIYAKTGHEKINNMGPFSDYYRAISYAEQKKFRAARKTMRRLLKNEKNTLPIRYRSRIKKYILEYSWRMGQYKEALRLCKDYGQTLKDRHLLALSYMACGQYRQAESIWLKLAREDKQSAEGYRHSIDRMKLARQTIKREITPKTAVAVLEAGLFLRRYGKMYRLWENKVKGIRDHFRDNAHYQEAECRLRRSYTEYYSAERVIMWVIIIVSITVVGGGIAGRYCIGRNR